MKHIQIISRQLNRRLQEVEKQLTALDCLIHEAAKASSALCAEHIEMQISKYKEEQDFLYSLLLKYTVAK